jgi:DeoR family transcriptional regulator, fructose operon transcriptional repressor
LKKREIQASRVIEMLQVNSHLGVKAVSDSLGISSGTTRRLLARLEADGKVIRTHGGVRLALPLSAGYSYYLSSTHRYKEKTCIGQAAAELVVSGDKLFLDSGTTVLKLAEALAVRVQAGTLTDLVVLTNSLALVETLARWCRVTLVGGDVRMERRDVCGPVTEETLRQFHMSKAFLGADAIDIRGGFMTTDERTEKMNEIVLQNCRHAYVLADSEKFNKDSFVRYAELERIEVLFTDAGIAADTLRRYTEAGARIRVVPVVERAPRGEGAPKPPDSRQTESFS